MVSNEGACSAYYYVRDNKYVNEFRMIVRLRELHTVQGNEIVPV